MRNLRVYDKAGEYVELAVSEAMYERPYMEDASWVDPAMRGERPHYKANLSSITTRLIHEAGRWCKHYASDLLIWLAAVKKASFEYSEADDLLFVFGMREDGIDNGITVASNMKDPGGRYMYRAVWGLELRKRGHTAHYRLFMVDRIKDDVKSEHEAPSQEIVKTPCSEQQEHGIENDMKTAHVVFRVNGRFNAIVPLTRDLTRNDVIKIATAIYTDADFGELEDIDAEVCRVEYSDGKD